MQLNNIIFDFNGTIIDDVDLCLKILNKMLVMRNHKPIGKKRYKEIFKFPIIDYYELAGFDFKNNKDNYQELAIMFQNIYHDECNSCPLYDNAVETFKRYYKTKRLIILSATITDELKKQLDYYGITKYFKDILGIDSIFVKGKIDVAKRFFTQNDIDLDKTVVIGDTDHDFEVSKELGCHSILFSQGHQDRKILESCHPDRVIDNLGELWDIIQ